MEYTIEIDYKTGDSFHSEVIYNEGIGCVFKDLESAKTALQYIKEHYLEYKKARDYYGMRRGTNNWKVDDIKGKLWYCKEFWELQIEVPTGFPDRPFQVISAFWTGYFETLYAGRIVVVGGKGSDVGFSI